MTMRQVAADLWRLPLVEATNVYLAGDVLIDSGSRLARGRLFAALKQHIVRAHALTHAHFDHQGCSHSICERFGVPLWCGEGRCGAFQAVARALEKRQRRLARAVERQRALV